MGEPLARLIAALAALDAEDYLREIAAETEAANEPGENPGLPATGEAA